MVFPSPHSEFVPQGPPPPFPPTQHGDNNSQRVCDRESKTVQEHVYSSSSSASSSPPFAAAAALARLRLTRPARAPPYGEVSEKSMCWMWVKGEVGRAQEGGRGRGRGELARKGMEGRGGRAEDDGQRAARSREMEGKRRRTFCESRRTTNDGTLTICLPTLWGRSRRVSLAAAIARVGERRDAPDVALADEDASVVDRLGEAALEDLGLEAALEEVLDLEGEDVVEAHALLVKDTDADQAVGAR